MAEDTCKYSHVCVFHPFSRCEGEVKHYRVWRDDRAWVTVDHVDYFENLFKLVEVKIYTILICFLQIICVSITSRTSYGVPLKIHESLLGLSSTTNESPNLRGNHSVPAQYRYTNDSSSHLEHEYMTRSSAELPIDSIQ